MSELLPELAAITEAIQRYVNATSDGPEMLSQAVVIYETVSYDSEDGQPQRRIGYTCPTENFSLSGGLGLVQAGGYQLRCDILGTDE